MLPRSAGNNVKIERGNGEILQILLPHSASNSVKVNRDRDLLVQLPANFLYQIQGLGLVQATVTEHLP